MLSNYVTVVDNFEKVLISPEIILTLFKAEQDKKQLR